MGIKIQIASLEALERLIGGDSQLEIEIRESVVQNFAKKHLKGVAEATNFKQIQNAVENYMSDTYLDIQRYPAKSTFKPEVINDLKGKLLVQGQSFLNTKVEEVLKALGSKERLEQTVNIAVDRIVNEIEVKITSGHIEKLVNQRLKERLGLS